MHCSGWTVCSASHVSDWHEASAIAAIRTGAPCVAHHRPNQPARTMTVQTCPHAFAHKESRLFDPHKALPSHQSRDSTENQSRRIVVIKISFINRYLCKHYCLISSSLLYPIHSELTSSYAHHTLCRVSCKSSSRTILRSRISSMPRLRPMRNIASRSARRPTSRSWRSMSSSAIRSAASSLPP